MNFSDYLTSLIRTWVPVIVGSVLAWLAAKTGIVLDENASGQVVLAVSAFFIGAYYGLVRWLEPRFPWLGWLLGSPKQPGYAPPQSPAHPVVAGWVSTDGTVQMSNDPEPPEAA